MIKKKLLNKKKVVDILLDDFLLMWKMFRV